MTAILPFAGLVLAGEDLFCDLPDGRKICYRTYGVAPGEPLLLIAGLSLQLIYWPPDLIEGLVLQGYRVIVMDNRDVGRSSHSQVKPPSRWQILLRRPDPLSYDLGDMAEDVIHLLDHLGLPAVHLVGMSMGGMIAQTIAARHPRRVQSLTSIFSSTGAPNVGQPSSIVRLSMLRKPSASQQGRVRDYLRSARYIGSTRFVMNDDAIRQYAEQAWERSSGDANAGVLRQIAAIIKSGDRTCELNRIRAPTLVIHGDDDPLVATSGGYATAAAIPDARFVLLEGLGHFIAASAAPVLLDLIVGHTRRAAGRHSAGDLLWTVNPAEKVS